MLGSPRQSYRRARNYGTQLHIGCGRLGWDYAAHNAAISTVRFWDRAIVAHIYSNRDIDIVRY